MEYLTGCKKADKLSIYPKKKKKNLIKSLRIQIKAVFSFFPPWQAWLGMKNLTINQQKQQTSSSSSSAHWTLYRVRGCRALFPIILIERQVSILSGQCSGGGLRLEVGGSEVRGRVRVCVGANRSYRWNVRGRLLYQPHTTLLGGVESWTATRGRTDLYMGVGGGCCIHPG